MPRMLLSRSSRGRSTDVVTVTWPARWTITCASTAVAMVSSISRTSPVGSGTIGTKLRLQPGQIRLQPLAAEVVIDSHLFTTTQKTVDVIRADETGAAGDEIAHERILQKACAGELQRSFDLPARAEPAPESDMPEIIRASAPSTMPVM